MTDDFVQKFNLEIHSGVFSDLSNEDVRSKMQALMDIGYVTFDVTFGQKVPKTPPAPVIKTETVWREVYVCSAVGCTYQSTSLAGVRAHRGRVHRVQTIKVTP